MKKVKKIFAILMTLAMIMGLGMTAFAVESVDVTVTNVNEGATVKYVQIIEPSNTTETGWTFTEAGNAFKNSISPTADAQDVIWGLLKYQTPTLTIPDSAGASPVAITATALETAFGTVTTTNDASVSGTTATFQATTAGVYAVKATDASEKYSYSPMGAYVAFTYGGDGTVSGLENGVTINAKKQENTPTKTSSESDGVAAVGKEVTYEIDTIVPYIDLSVTTPIYKITDTIHGGNYKLETEAPNAGKLKVTYTIGDSEEKTAYVDVDDVDSSNVLDQYKGYEEHQTFTLDLSDVVTDRTNANKAIHIEYKAIVKELTVVNEAVPGGTHEFNPAINTLYTGTITMTKYGDDDNTLSGAGFNVYYKDGATTYWAQTATAQDAEGNDIAGAYYVTGWTTNESLAGEIFTGTAGTVSLAGLDDSVTYYYKEKTAPEGYSVNTTDEDAEWNRGTSADAKTGSVSMTDTKLSSLPLPGTGGIGTTIFTIGGIVIMIGAAGLFFANRRKNNSK